AGRFPRASAKRGLPYSSRTASRLRHVRSRGCIAYTYRVRPMRRVLRNVVLMLSFACVLGGVARSASAQTLIACGWDEVFAIDVDEPSRKVWSWKAADRPELPEAYRDLFRTTDECKPVSGDRVLIAASSDGAALVDRASGRAV